MNLRFRWLALVLGATLLAAALASADDALEEVLVTGQQPGPGLWKVTRPGDPHGHVLWILGNYSPLPKKHDVALDRTGGRAGCVSGSARTRVGQCLRGAAGRRHLAAVVDRRAQQSRRQAVAGGRACRSLCALAAAQGTLPGQGRRRRGLASNLRRAGVVSRCAEEERPGAVRRRLARSRKARAQSAGADHGTRNRTQGGEGKGRDQGVQVDSVRRRRVLLAHAAAARVRPGPDARARERMGRRRRRTLEDARARRAGERVHRRGAGVVVHAAAGFRRRAGARQECMGGCGRAVAREQCSPRWPCCPWTRS